MPAVGSVETVSSVPYRREGRSEVGGPGSRSVTVGFCSWPASCPPMEVAVLTVGDEVLAGDI
ncbi:MAG: hypothetical protein V5A40_12740, partial [Haloarculaceae archaeon]